MKKLNRDDLGPKIGHGNTAEVFEYENGKVCKLFKEGYPKEAVEREFKNASIMFRSNLSVPEPYELIMIEKRMGISYERIEGKTMYALFQEGIWSGQKMIEQLVKLHEQILMCQGTEGLNYKSFCQLLVQDETKEAVQLRKEIAALPEGDHILHGDFHPDNVLVKPDGTLVIIDFMNVCIGPAEYDIARTYFLLNTVDSTVAEAYRSGMNIQKQQLRTYLNVIEKCRKYEGS